MRLPTTRQAVSEPASNIKLRIDLNRGVVDVEGDVDLVREVYEDFKDVLLERVAAPVSEPARMAAAAPTQEPRLVHSGSVTPYVPRQEQERPNLDEVDMNLSTNSIATLLEVTNGHELVVAAMAQLMIVQGKDSCTRKEINTEMKNATDYYKQNMTKSLSAVLESHKKAGRIIQVSSDVYTLATKEIESLEKTLAE